MQRSRRAAHGTQGWHVGGWETAQAGLGEAHRLGFPPHGGIRRFCSVRGEVLLYCLSPVGPSECSTVRVLQGGFRQVVVSPKEGVGLQGTRQQEAMPDKKAKRT